MSDRTTYTESKIPLLGDIPLLGYLFKYSQKSRAKTNLLILLTPHVIKDQLDIEEIVQRKVRERREFMRTFTNFRRMGYESNVDYRRKRGLVEEINHVVATVEGERRLLDELEQKKDTFPDGPIDYDPDQDDTPDPAGGVAEPAPGGDKDDGAGKDDDEDAEAKKD